MAAPRKFKAPTRRAFTEKPEFNCFKCGANWPFSESKSHCTACHQSFGSTTGFDDHRYGKFDGTFGSGGRRCRGPEWMTGKGWWLDEHNCWRYPQPKDDRFSNINEGTD